MTAVTTVYLDHAAATPCSPDVIESMMPYMTDRFYNPSSPYAPAVKVKRDIDTARHQIAAAIGARPADIIFTAGATESINLAFTAAAGGHVIVPTTEHHAVLKAADQSDVTSLAVDPRGLVDPLTLEQSIRPDTRLVSIALANNEIGTIQSMSALSAVVRKERRRRADAGDATPIWLHTDASQGAGQIDINVARLGIDMMTLNAAKCYGPKQMGLLWKNSAIDLHPVVRGGGQEQGLRSGTENVAGIIGFAKALTSSEAKRKSEAKRLAGLRDKLERRLTSEFPEAVISGHPKKRLPGHLHISFDSLDAERLIFMLESVGVYVATGSACAANSGTRSHVLEAIGLRPEVIDGSLRITLGRGTDETGVDRAGDAIVSAVKKEISRVYK